MLRGWKKKARGEKKAEAPNRSREVESLKTTPAEDGMSKTNLPSVHIEDVTQSLDQVKSPSDLAVTSQRQSSNGELETRPSAPKPTKYLKHVSTESSTISDRGYVSQASMSTLGEGGLVPFRQRTSSTLSSVSNVSSGSYHTAMSGGASPSSSGHVPPRFAVSRQDDMLKEILEKVTQLEKKFESHNENFATRVGDLEEKVKYIQQQREVETSNTRTMGSDTLPDLIEDKEEGDDILSAHPLEKDETTSTSQTLAEESRHRVYTDSVATRIAHAKELKKKRGDFSKKKWMSLQSSKLPNQACHKNIILWLAHRVTEWKFIGRWLELDENMLTRIETEHPKSVREQCYQMFQHWKSVDPENFNYITLGEALRKESMELFNEYVEKVPEFSVNTS